MNRTFKKALALCLTLIMVLSAVPLGGLKDLDWGITASAKTVAASGSCGENVTYTYDSVTKELVISGEGPMTNYNIGEMGYEGSPFYNSDIKKVVIKDGVTTISDDAFRHCYELESVSIPNSVTLIADGAFHSCNLISVTIPDNVTSIGYSAFHSNSNLESVKIGKSVTEIDSYAFNGCKKLTSISISDSVTTIGYGAFYDCSSLTKITLPDSVTTIGNSAFNGCYNLSNITIGKGVTSIGASAFYNTGYYKDIDNWDIDEALYIGNYLIKASPRDEKYAVKENTVLIADEALKGLDIRVVYIPDTVKNIGSKAFLTCTNLKYVYWGASEENVSAVNIVTNGNDCLINASFNYYSHEHTPNDGTVTKEPNCYEEGEKRARCIFCEALMTLKIPVSHTEVTVYGKAATCFVEGYTDSTKCDKCNIVIKAPTVIPMLSHIDEDDNGRCDACNYTMPNVIDAGYCGYKNKEDASYVLYADGTMVIRGTGRIDSFYGLTNVVKLEIGEGITAIGESCFNNCSQLVEVNLPSTLKEIGADAFSNCTKLTELDIPDSVTKIENNILSNTPWMHNQSAGLLVLDGWILGYKGTMPNEFTLSIVKDIKGISKDLISRWEINDIVLDEENTHFVLENRGLYNKDKTVLYKACPRKNDDEFIVPDTVKTIGAYAFQNNNSRRVVLPDSLEVIEEGAFQSASLTNLDIPLSVKTLGNAALFNVLNVYYPGDLKQWQSIEGSDRAIASNTSLFLSHTHSYDKGVIERSNCEDYGTITFTCVHGDYYTVEVPPVEHEWQTEYTVQIEGTCNSEGYKYIKCDNCKATKDHTSYYGEHSWSDWKTVEPNCINWTEGYDIRTCSVCNNSETTNYEKPSHDWSAWTTVAPDCKTGKEGYDIRSCSACGLQEIQNPVSASHSWSDWYEVDGDCASDKWGYYERKCAVCGTLDRTSEIAPECNYVYTFIPATTTSNGEESYKCEKCGDIDWIDIIPRISYISLSSTTVTYNGKVRTPSVNIRDDYWNYLSKGADYTYEYLDGDMKDPGVYKVKVTFMGKYAGEEILTFTIRPGKTKNFFATTTYTTAELKWDAVEGADVYRIYQTFDGETKLIATTADTTYKVKNLAPASTYRFSVQAGTAYSVSNEETETTTQPTTYIETTTKPTTTAPTTTHPTTTQPTEPTTKPTTQPTTEPTTQPTSVTTTAPTTTQPTTQPTTEPTTTKPTTQPTSVTTTAPYAAYSDAQVEYIWGDTVTIKCYTTGASGCEHVDENGDRICDICEDETIIFAGNYADTTYKLYDDGTLIISGYGIAYCRWQNYRDRIKRVIVEEGITGLGSGCLAMCLNMEEISLPSTLERIYDEAFYSCEKLKAIDILEGVWHLGNSVFSGCISLESLTIPEGITELRYYFASGCTALKQVNLPSTIEVLGDGVFAECTSLEEIELPESLRRISGAFKYCSNLKSINLPEGLEEITYEAFRDCDSLTEIEFPESLYSIGYASFYDCDGFEELTIPSTVRELYDSTFANCSGLKKVSVASSVIDYAVFNNCENLEEVIFLEGVETIGWYAFENCQKLSKATFSNTVRNLYGWTFANCFSLDDVVLPESLESIGSAAFHRCHGLTNIDLGGTKTIQDNAFEDCIRLAEITLDGNVEYLGASAFINCIRLKKITIENPDCDIQSYIGTIPEKAVIYGYEGSTAEKYADDWMRNFVSLGGAHTHRFEESVTTEPTCTEAGEKTFTCFCGASYTEEIDALGHNETSLNAVAATCTENGLTAGKKCDRCGEILVAQQTIPASGHSMSVSEELSVAPTCKTAGKTVKVCANCDGKEETTLPADENAHNYEWTNVTATCTAKGSRTGICTVCKKTETQEIPALGHDIADDEWVIVNVATCTSAGDKVAVCNRCHITVKEAIPVIAHKDDNNDNKCDVCGATVKTPEPTDPPTTEPTQPSDPTPPDTQECDCGCHKDGIGGFFFRFILFFQKLFGRNEICECGEAHY